MKYLRVIIDYEGMKADCKLIFPSFASKFGLRLIIIHQGFQSTSRRVRDCKRRGSGKEKSLINESNFTRQKITSNEGVFVSDVRLKFQLNLYDLCKISIRRKNLGFIITRAQTPN